MTKGVIEMGDLGSLPNDILEKYEIYNYNHAIEILSQTFKVEYDDLINVLRSLNISINDIMFPGGNESPIPPKFASILYPIGWREVRISGDLIIKFFPRKGERKGVFSDTEIDRKVIENYIDGHNIDFVKGKIAIDIEWNSKDQTFDRDLFAMRTYYECGVISVGIIITRSESLNDVFKHLGIMNKYGASTTWMGKLLPRLDSRRHGGCPIIAIGIKPSVISDWRGKNDK